MSTFKPCARDHGPDNPAAECPRCLGSGSDPEWSSLDVVAVILSRWRSGAFHPASNRASSSNGREKE